MNNNRNIIQEIAELTGLSEDAVRLLIYWKNQPAVSYNVEFINEIIMKTPEYIYPKYRSLCKERNSEQKKDSEEVVASCGISRGTNDFRPSSEHSEREEELSREISDIIFHFLSHNKEVSLSECKNYASARKSFPCTRERLKRIQDELLKKRKQFR